MLDRLLEPLQYSFMIEALGMAALIGTVCAAMSCFLVLKGWSLMGDALSHAVLPGIVIAYIIGVPLSLGAFVSGFVCAGATGWIKANSRIKEDTVMGVVFTGLFALGLVMFTKIETDVHLNHILFGSLLGIEYSEMIQALVITSIAFLTIIIYGRDLLLYCFDIGQAKVIGLNTTVIHYIFLALISATVVASLQAVGIILTVAMLITPGCIGYMLCNSFWKMLGVAVGSSLISSLVGTYISYFINGSTGACIVLTQSFIFFWVMIFAPRYGILSTRLRLRQVK
ncbi:MAG: metal ABC transporter permease [bacterium]|nr:metal ABC transporter permease [bacterium]